MIKLALAGGAGGLVFVVVLPFSLPKRRRKGQKSLLEKRKR